MEREAFAVRERIYAIKLNILCLGVAARDGKILTANEGAVWGDIVLSTPALRDMRVSRALTYVEVTTLTREALEECLELCPDAKPAIKNAALLTAIYKATE